MKEVIMFEKIFAYPSKHYIISFFSLIGFSLSVLIDKNQTSLDGLNSVIILFGLAAGINLALDILTPFSKMGSKNSQLSELSTSRLNYNISFGIFCFLVFFLARLLFVFDYENSFNFVLGAFQWAGVLIAFYSWSEKKKRMSTNN